MACRLAAMHVSQLVCRSVIGMCQSESDMVCRSVGGMLLIVLVVYFGCCNGVGSKVGGVTGMTYERLAWGYRHSGSNMTGSNDVAAYVSAKNSAN